jgi:hypothetical protein
MSTTEGFFFIVGSFLLFLVALAMGAVIKSVWEMIKGD